MSRFTSIKIPQVKIASGCTTQENGFWFSDNVDDWHNSDGKSQREKGRKRWAERKQNKDYHNKHNKI